MTTLDTTAATPHTESAAQTAIAPGETSAARAFNAGSDARLRGEPEVRNPFGRNVHDNRARAWLQGWLDVDRHWGEHARRPVRALPTVGGETAG